MALSYTEAADIAKHLIYFYVKTGALSQTTQDKPLMRELRKGQKTFPGGWKKISTPVQGAFMVDNVSGFFAGYSQLDTLTFGQAINALRAEETWYEIHAGLEISGTEMKADGISLVDDRGGTREHASAAEVRITTSMFKNRIEDFGESWARAFQKMLWSDGSTDAKAPAGIRSILTDTPAVGTTHGISRATYSWWRHRALVGASAITPSAAGQTLTKALRSEVRQLRRYGGKPSLLLAGSTFIEALELEVHEKGVYTQEGFANEGKTDIGMAKISMRGVGTFEYDPTMDDIGWAKRCIIVDPRRLKLWVMDGEDTKTVHPTRPYDANVYLESLFWTGGVMANQLNCHGLYETT
ncbi:MAG TPA: phage major capsid protein [Polyangiaceae bacterium]